MTNASDILFFSFRREAIFYPSFAMLPTRLRDVAGMLRLSKEIFASVKVLAAVGMHYFDMLSDVLVLKEWLTLDHYVWYPIITLCSIGLAQAVSAFAIGKIFGLQTGLLQLVDAYMLLLGFRSLRARKKPDAMVRIINVRDGSVLLLSPVLYCVNAGWVLSFRIVTSMAAQRGVPHMNVL